MLICLETYESSLCSCELQEEKIKNKNTIKFILLFFYKVIFALREANFSA